MGAGIKPPSFGAQPPHCPVCHTTTTSVTSETVPLVQRLCDPKDEEREPGDYRHYEPCGHTVVIGATEAEVEPLLASEASRRFMDRYAQSSAPVHEIAADAIRLAEDRGVEAAMVALEAEVNDLGSVYVDIAVDKRDLMRRIDKVLGR